MSARIQSIDMLRGLALLGILLMNMASFALPMAAYHNPLSWEPTLLNKVVHGFTHLVADQKFMGTFSLLFGASMLLLMGRTEAAGRHFGHVHYARMGWLFLFGILHGLLLWQGDILGLYAFCGFLLFLFRKRGPLLLAILGLLIFLAPALWAPGYQGILEGLDEVNRLPVLEMWDPDPLSEREEIEAMRGSWGREIGHRLEQYEGGDPARMEGELSLALVGMEAICRAFGMMLLGMALFKWRVLSGERSRAFYLRVAAIGLPLGLTLAGWGLWQQYAHGWNFAWGLSMGRVPNHLATVALVLAYASLAMLWSRGEFLAGLQARLSAVGRMAFSNYIGQTLLCTFLFYGRGFGLFARLGRLEMLGVTMLVWVLQLFFSAWWLERFRYGPLEWLWRTLTFMRIQPLRR